MNPFLKQQKQTSIFVTAGYPSLHSLNEQIVTLEQSGVDFIEIGIPFSDPMADGETIQMSSEIALRNGMTVSTLFDQLRSVKSEIPLVIMSYFNPILHYGLVRFLENCSSLGIHHVIIPDISLEVYEHLYQSEFEEAGVTLCFLITPTTEGTRIQRMSALSSKGFIYLVSSNMTTGNQSPILDKKQIARIKKNCASTPLMIGFGIKTRDDVVAVHNVADGAIIGSAYIQALKDNESQAFISSILVR